MKWSVKKPRTRSPCERPSGERTQTPGHEEIGMWNVAQHSPEVGGTRSRGTLHVDWGEIFWIIHSGSDAGEKKGLRWKSRNRKAEGSVNSRFARVLYGESGMVNHPVDTARITTAASERYKSGGDESRKATREAAMTLASEIGNCPANRITNACALWPLMESKHRCEMLRVTSTKRTRRDETRI